ncbi:MAG: hypothetical protein KDK39_13400 [Leptospiraceae bacterium]|nr:hypothetical protein [Leptospiraceae bacterium]
MSTYEFNYLINKNKVELTADGKLVARIGPIQKKTLPLAGLTGLYVKHNESSASDQLILGYQSSAGKSRKLSIYADEGARGLRELVAELLRRYPHIDLQAKGDQEALKILGARDTEKIALLVTPLIIIGVMALFTAPLLLHGLDSGRVSLTVGELVQQATLESRNIVLSGHPVDSAMMEEKTTSKGTTTTKVYIPIVEPGWRKDQPVGVILQSDALTESGLGQLLEQRQFRGVVRNIWWEGPSSDHIDFFTTEYGLVFTTDPILVELQADGLISDLTLWILIMSVTSVIMLLVVALMWFIRYRAK